MTTIRLSTGTRDRLASLRHADGASSVEEVLIRLLDEHAARTLLDEMRRDAEHARSNRDDLAEVAAVQAELDEISAW